jgi:hypothetical protein
MSDPSRPGEPLDVVGAGHERDPWRPGTRTWSLIAVLLVLAAIAVPVGLNRQHQADERALDTASVTGLALAPTGDPEARVYPDGVVGIGVRNDTDRAVTLVGLQVLADGYRPEVVNRPLKPNELISVQLKDTATCSPSLVRQVPENIRFTVRSSRGRTATVIEPLVDSAGGALNQSARERCQYKGTLEAFLPSITETAQIVGRTLTVTAQLANTGRLTLAVTRLESYPGVTVTTTPRLPLVLPYAPPAANDGLTGTMVTFRLTVTDCATVTGADQALSENGDPLTTAGIVVVHLRGGDGDATTTLSLESTEQELVQAACP